MDPMKHIMSTVTPKNIHISDAEGAYLFSRENGKILDWFADVGTVNLGYKPKGLSAQLKDIPQHIPNTLIYDEKVRVSELLCTLTHMDKLFFCNSGSEANEAAIKIIRKWNYVNKTGKSIIYTIKGGFHGRTYGAVSAGDGAPYHYEGFEPHLSGFKHWANISEINWDDCAGVMFATMYGNNDARIYQNALMQEIWTKTRENKVPLVLDEVQVGAARTGTWNGFDNYNGIIPEVLCLGKGIACGIPTGVTLARGEFADMLTPGTHYSTFGGSPLSIAGIDYLMEWYCNNGNGSNVLRKGTWFKEQLWKLKHISNIRGVGLWIAFDVEDDKAMELSDAMLDKQLFCPTFRKNAIKMTPMLNTTVEEAAEGINKLSEAIKYVFGSY